MSEKESMLPSESERAAHQRAPVITLMTDFGLVDASVGAIRGVLASLAPGVPVADIGHQIPPYDIERGARLLEYAVPYYPPGTIHVAVVDPGVGTERRGIALRTHRGDILVGPDNGLLVWGAEALGGIDEAIELKEEAYRLHPVSHTFHARDIFCPAAAHLAVGLDVRALGPAVELGSLQRLRREQPTMGKGELSAPVATIATFGNCHFDVLGEHWERAGLVGEQTIAMEVNGRSWELPFRRTFGEVPAGSALLLRDAFGRLCLAVNQGNASSAFGLERGTQVRFRRTG